MICWPKRLYRVAELPEEEQLAAIAALRERLASPEVDQRWWAARTLAELPFSQTHNLLMQALEDPDPSVRQCAALGLRAQIKRTSGWDPEPGTREALLLRLLDGLKDPDPLAARLAADALMAIGEPAVAQLLELLNKSDQAVRLLLVRILAEIGDQRAIPALLDALDEDFFLWNTGPMKGWKKWGWG